jgi:hypothetical protein
MFLLSSAGVPLCPVGDLPTAPRCKRLHVERQIFNFLHAKC